MYPCDERVMVARKTRAIRPMHSRCQCRKCSCLASKAAMMPSGPTSTSTKDVQTFDAVTHCARAIRALLTWRAGSRLQRSASLRLAHHSLHSATAIWNSYTYSIVASHRLALQDPPYSLSGQRTRAVLSSCTLQRVADLARTAFASTEDYVWRGLPAVEKVNPDWHR